MSFFCLRTKLAICKKRTTTNEKLWFLHIRSSCAWQERAQGKTSKNEARGLPKPSPGPSKLAQVRPKTAQDCSGTFPGGPETPPRPSKMSQNVPATKRNRGEGQPKVSPRAPPPPPPLTPAERPRRNPRAESLLKRRI